ncbi:hypothetical protein OG21DRAFT_543720 [Imleria badia]|nr:hypothetical protein OG21DRAFT_543720 [Imleria badia]
MYMCLVLALLLKKLFQHRPLRKSPFIIPRGAVYRTGTGTTFFSICSRTNHGAKAEPTYSQFRIVSHGQHQITRVNSAPNPQYHIYNTTATRAT